MGSLKVGICSENFRKVQAINLEEMRNPVPPECFAGAEEDSGRGANPGGCSGPRTF
jgi:hypothetical protein